MIDIAKEIAEKHSQDEIIEFLYECMKSVNKTLSDATKNQNLIEVGAVVPVVSQCTAVLKNIKNANDLRKLDQS